MSLKKKWTRLLSGFLAVVMVVGLFPTFTIPAAAANVPDRVFLANTGYDGDNMQYISPGLNNDKCTFHIFKFKNGSSQYPGFCATHGGYMGASILNQPWNNPTEYNGSAKQMLNFYYHRWDIAQRLNAAYPDHKNDFSWFHSECPDPDGQKYYTDTMLEWINAVVQSIYWMDIQGAIKNPIDSTWIAKAAAERDAVLDQLYPNADKGMDSVPWIETVLAESVPNRSLYVYTYAGVKTSAMGNRTVQRILIPVLDSTTDPGRHEAYITLQKVNENGATLAGAVFSVYDDEGNLIDTFSTTTNPNEVYGPFPIPNYASKGTFYVEETTAPAGYNLGDMAGRRISVNVDSAINTENNPAVVPGSPFQNQSTSYDDPTGVIRKIDKRTGRGLAGAWFHLEGSSETGTPYQGKDIGPTDASGSIQLQWADPSADNYIAPGSYTVTEKTPPTGYTKSDEAYHLVLMFNEVTKVQTHSGPITFENEKQHKIIIKKTNGRTPLAGAKFEIYKDDKLVATKTTDGSGTITFAGTDGKGLENGWYHIVEVEAPPGYQIPFIHSKDIHIDSSDLSVVEHELNFSNNTYPEILIKKVDENGRPLAGATFEIMIDGTKFANDVTTGPDGTIVIDYDTYHDYLGADKNSWTIQAREVSPPAGYMIDNPNWKTVELKDGQKFAELDFKDTKYPEIKITKVDGETKLPLKNTVFTVQINGKNIGDFTTDENGEILITYDKYREFLGEEKWGETSNWAVTVTETKVPDNYNLDDQPESVGGQSATVTKHLTYGMTLLTFEFEDISYRDIKVTKLDAETNWPLAGATYRLHCIKADPPLTAGNIADRQLTTDKTGSVTFVDVPNGTYEITEVQAPIGYDPNGKWEDNTTGKKTVIVTSDSDPVIEFTHMNEPKSGIRIYKRDAATDEPIKGAVFEIKPLYPLTATPFERTTDDNGIIVLEGLAEGSYQITEKAVPDPYVLDNTPTTVEVNNQHNAYPVTLYNYAEGMLYIQKLDGVTHEPLAGAYFDIHTAGGTFVAQVGPTGPTGFTSYAGLKPGSYVVKEVKAPDGHAMDTTPQSFEVSATDSGKIYSLIFDNMPWANLWIHKTDALTGLGLEGAVFKITKGNGEIVKQNAITDKGGFIKVNGLDAGTYIFTETKAPDGYILDSTAHTVTLRQDDTEVFEVENKKPGGIAVLKVDAATDKALSGAVFQLYGIDDKPIGGTVTTGADGYARWSNLTPGFYQVKEVSAPDGYVTDSAMRKIEVKEFETTEYQWENTQTSTITVLKKDSETLTPLGGAEFEIRDMDNKVVDVITTDLNGTATTKQLDLGWYKVVETKAPTGYLLNEKEYPVEVKADVPAKVEVPNTAMKGIIIHKRDGITKEPLSGAWFELQTIDGKVVQEQFMTDASGTAVTDAVAPGNYYIVETKAPDGYLLNTEKFLVNVEAGKASVINVDDMPKSIIQVYKTDSVSGDPIMGVEFEVKDSSGKLVEVITTDKTGWAYTQVVDPGEYTVTESKAADGYTIDTTEHRITLEEGKNSTLKLTNVPNVSLHVVKVDSVTRKALAGAVFELRYDTGHGDCTYVGTYTTDTYGKIDTEPLTPGFYMLKEIKAPDGYVLGEETETRVCVKAGTSDKPEANEVVIENQQAATLIARKIDSKTGKPIAGAVFKLETADHGLIGTMESDANGEATFTGLTAGHYIVTETQAPPGYQISGCPSQTITVSYGKDNYVDFKDAENGSLVIILQDKHTSEYLPGGEFTVIRESDQTVVFNSKTDITGTLVVGDLAPGWYTVIQKFSPDGYTMIDETIKVEIKMGTQQTVNFYDETAGLVIEKVDKNVPKLMLEGARFQVLRESDGIVIGEYVTGKDGTANVGGLVPGRYTVKELVAPDGYLIDEAPKTVEVKGGTNAHVTFTDTAMASITINVIDKDTKAPLPGSVVEVWKQNGELVKSFTADKTGMIETEKMAPGYYVLKLVKVVDGYKAEVTETTVELKSEEVTYTFECVANGTITIYSADENTTILPGMKVSVTKIDGTKVGEYVTGTDGKVVIKDLPAGWYVVKEIVAPDGFNIVKKCEQNIEVKAGQNSDYTFIHTEQVSSNINVIVVGSDKKPLAGCKVELYAADGKLVGSYVTDASGNILTDALAPGKYTVKLIEVPAGYKVTSTTSTTIEVVAGGSVTYTFECIANGTLRVISKDSASKNIPGMKFSVTSVDGKLVGEYTTSSDGSIIIPEDLAPGWYIVKETQAPAGYDIITAEKRVEVKTGATASIEFLHNSLSHIEVTVVDQNSKAPLAGCVVEIWEQNGNHKVGSFTTNANGTIISDKLDAGTYVVKLVKVVDGYKAVTSETTLTIVSGKTSSFTFECISDGALRVFSKDDAGKNLSGMKFQVVNADGKLIGEYTTAADGSLLIPATLVPGWYVVKETKAPAGYDIVTAEKRIEVEAGETAEVEFTHNSLSHIEVTVVDQNSKAPLAGCVVEIWEQNGNHKVGSFTTNANGTIISDKLDAGTYVVKLVKVVDGYKAVTSETTLTIVSGKSASFTFECISDGGLKVISKDDKNKSVSDMKFKVVSVDGQLVGEFTTAADGSYTINSLAPGWYKVIELTAPSGLDIVTAEKQIQVKAGSVSTVEFEHKALANIVISVVDKSTRAPLNGCLVEIYDSDGGLVDSLYTDSTGKVTTESLTAGKYTLKLLKVTDGYEAVVSEGTVNVVSGKTATYTFECVAKGGINITSLDGKNKPIAGMTVKVTTIDGVLVGEYTTSNDGTVLVTDLSSGWYIITETEAPVGYDIMVGEQRVEVKSGNTSNVSFKHAALAQIEIDVVDQNSRAPISNCTVELWKQNGNRVATFTTDASGKILTSQVETGNYVVKLTNVPEGYKAVSSESTVKAIAGETVNCIFECISNGVLKVMSLDSKDNVLSGMKFTITTLDGSVIGSYKTASDGTFTTAALQPGWYVVTETEAPAGYNINSSNSVQKVEVKAGEQAIVAFNHIKTYGMQIRTTCSQTGASVPGATYQVTQLNGAIVGTYTSDAAGLAFAELTPGWYVVTPVSAPSGYQFVDTTPRNVQVLGDQLTTVDFLVKQQSSLRIKVIDGSTAKGLYGVRILLKNGTNCIKEYTTNNEGYITLDQTIVAGGYTLEMISAPNGYIVDTVPKSLDVLNAQTTEVTWKLYKDAGQIQIVVTSADYNKTRDLPAGTPLQGAVFEVMNADTYQVMCQMISDSSGVAASSGLPIGRYIVKMVTAPAYYGVNTEWSKEIRIKINNDVVREYATVKSVTLGTSITQQTNKTIRAGSSMRVDITKANNNSDVRLDNFYLHIKVPTDAARISTLSPGTWNQAVWYSIQYKTNMSDYKLLASNLSSTNRYTYDLSSKSLGLQANEYVTDVRLVFGTVPAGFAMQTKTSYTMYVLSTVYNNYKLINRLEMGGQHNTTVVSTNHITNSWGVDGAPAGTASTGVTATTVAGVNGGQAAVSGSSGQWTTSTSIWTTTVTSKNKMPSSLPKTGY